MKTLRRMLSAMMLFIGLFNRPIMATENTSWGDVKAQLTQEPAVVDSAGKLVVSTTKAGGPRLEIICTTPQNVLLSAGNSVVVEQYQLRAMGKDMMLSDLFVEISYGLTNVRMYLSDSGVEVYSMKYDGIWPVPCNLNLVKGNVVNVEFRAEIRYSDGTLPSARTHLSIDILAGNSAKEDYSRVISTPAVQGIGGTVSYPWGCTGPEGFSSTTGEPCGQ